MNTTIPTSSDARHTPRLAVVGLLAAGLGAPVALSALAGNPLPSQVPTLDGLRTAITGGAVPEHFVIRVLAVICWVAWAQLIAAVGVELLRSRTGRRIRLPVLPPIHACAAFLVTSTGLGVASGPPASEGRLELAVALARSATPAATATAATPTRDAAEGPATTTAEQAGELVVPPPVGDPDREGDGDEVRTDEHVVQTGETLWGIAADRLGDPRRWPEIFELNRGRSQHDGGILEQPGDGLRAGWVLRVPRRDAADPVGTRGGSYEVQPGDTLWHIADHALADPLAWPSIHHLNQGRPQADGRTLDDPDLILPGWVLDLPTTDPTAPGADAAPTSPHMTPAAPEAATGAPDGGLGPADAVERAERAEEDAASADHDAGAVLERLREHTDSAAVPGRTDAPPRSTVGEDAHEPSHAPAGPDPVLPPAAVDPADPPTVLDPETTTPSPDEAPADVEVPATTLRLPRAETWPERHPSAPTADSRDPVGPTDPDGGDVLDLTDADGIVATAPRPGAIGDTLAGAGVFVAGIGYSLTRFRERRERRRMPGTRVRLAPPDEARLEQALRAAAGEHHDLARVEGALRTLAVGLRRRERCAPAIVGVNVAEEISLLLAEADLDPVDGFAVEDDGYSWVVAPSSAPEPDPTGTNAAALLPALATLGVTPTSQVLLNLEEVGSLSLSGSGALVHEALCAMALELGTGPWAHHVQTVVVGFGRELDALPTVTAVESVEDVLPIVAGRAALAARRLAGEQIAAPIDARARALDPEAWRPTIVLCAGPPGSGAHELVRLAGPAGGATLAAVFGGHTPEAAWQAELTDAAVRLLPVGVTLGRHRVPAQHRTAIIGLVREAAPGADDAPSDGSVNPAPDLRPDPPGLTVSHFGTSDPDPSGVEVAILGPVRVAGAEPFERRKALELVAYLATHPQGVDADQIQEALWPDRLVSPATLHRLMSIARRALGTAPDGAPRIPHAGGDGHYRLAPDVGLDHQRFLGLVEAAHAEPECAQDRLRAALTLVRGRPFGVPGGEFLWAHGEALLSAVVADVTDTAHDLACLYLDRGDARGAWWATRQGLLASPANEQLHRDRMLAADCAGDPDAVDRVMEELCRAIEIDECDACDMLHPLTVDLYERLRRRARVVSMTR